MNTSFQKVFDRFLEFQHSTLLALVARPSDARGGEGPSKRDQSISWKSASEFKLRDESNDDYVQVIPTATPSDCDDEDVKYITNIVVGIKAPQKFPTKVLSEEEKRIWFVVSWPSSLADVLQRICEMANAKTKLSVEPFRAT